jgi:hypothetical protein
LTGFFVATGPIDELDRHTNSLMESLTVCGIAARELGTVAVMLARRGQIEI